VRRIATVVVGAGPAGLLFSIVARLIYERRGGDAGGWPFFLFDRRATYERTHRLRMAPGPYREIAKDLQHPWFEAFLAFLEDEGFRPEVNRLEERLLALALKLGVRRELENVGPSAGGVALAELRGRLEREGRLLPSDRLTVVAADSVHSAVRDLVGRGATPVERRHQYLARLQVVGDGLPEALGVVEQYKLSKVLASLLDYRLNANGYAEIDLFLTADEHHAVAALGATPRAPVVLTGMQMRALRRAPFFRRIVDRFREGFGSGRCEVSLRSTFCLEHRFMERVVFNLRDLHAQVFLVGDAAISLPFFRGMACLARCAYQLAQAHCDLVALAQREPDPEEQREIQRTFFSPDRPVVYGTKPMFGRILRVEPTIWRGRTAMVVLHRWVGRYGVHVLQPNGEGWTSLHHLAPVSRRTAFADFAAQIDPALRYEREVAAVRRRELAVVESRARLVRGAREFVRVSSMLPFPMQTWFLSLPERDHRPTPWSLGAVVNLALAALAGSAAMGGLFLGTIVDPRLAWIWAAALPLQCAGGAAYAAARTIEGGPQRLTRAVWRYQILSLAVGGAALLFVGRDLLLRTLAGASWFVLALPFVVGLYVFEFFDRRWWSGARLEQESDG
jgi:hypothetical protein